MTPKPLFAMLPLAVAVSLSIPGAMAAEGDAKANANFEEVVVTSQRREQTLQEVPISVQVLSEDALTQNNVSTLSDIGDITPGLSFGANSEGETISMRGIATRTLSIGLQSSTAIYLDGIYLGGGSTQLGELQDIARIEVLRGPQGTLFGRNAVAGAISVTTNEPDDILSGNVKAGIGTNRLYYLNTVVNAPLSDTVLTRTTLSRSDSDGVFGNKTDKKRFGATDNIFGRTKVKWLAADDLTIDFALDAGKYKGSRSPLVLEKDAVGFNSESFSKLSDKRFPNSLVVIENGQPVAIDPSKGESTNNGFSLKLTLDLTDDLTLTSTTANRTSDVLGYSGSAGLVDRGFAKPVGGYISLTDDKRDELSQEFRLSGVYGDADWFVGLNMARTENKRRDQMALPASVGVDPAAQGNFGDSGQDVNVEIKNLALFGDAVIPLTEDINMSVGARYSKDSTEVEWLENIQRVQFFYANVGPGGIKVDDSWNNLSGRVVFDWQINDEVNAYAGLTQGYKAGGFATTLAPNFVDAIHPGKDEINPFNKETSLNYEMGLKTSLLDNRLFMNMAIYHTEYKDYQLQAASPTNQKITITDTADAISRGIELDTSWLTTDQLTLGVNLGLNHSEFRETNQVVDKGQKLLRAPKFFASLNLDYLQPLETAEIRYNLTYSYSSTQRLTNASLRSLNGPTATGQPRTGKFEKEDLYSGSFDNLNGRVTYTPHGQPWEVSLYATNILDKAYRADSHIQLTDGTFKDAGGFARAYTRNAPRAVGVELKYSFGDDI